MTADLLNLPLDTLVVLGAGYMAYCVAYNGRRNHHKPIDVTFLSLVFGLIAKAIMLALAFGLPITSMVAVATNETVADTGWFVPLVRAAIAVIGALGAAAVWRKWGLELWHKILRDTDVSYSDGLQTAWDEVRTNTNTEVTQITVITTNNITLMCDGTHEFTGEPFGPCKFGEDGSVALYVTHKAIAGGDLEERTTKAVGTEWGSKLTYVPAGQIERIIIRSRLR